MQSYHKGFGILGELITLITLGLLIFAGWHIWIGNDSSNETGGTKFKHFRVLVFTKTTGFYHDSIPAGIEAVKTLGKHHNFSVETTEDATWFSDKKLASYDAVIWLSTTGDVLNESQQLAFERYIKSGKGYVGVHSASDTEYGWPWYGGLVGAYFESHPKQQAATIKVEDHSHDSTSHLPKEWSRFDEWYNFKANPRGNVHVLLSLDETSYEGGIMLRDHPISWCHNYGGGRAWYTGLGHTKEAYSDSTFLRHLLGGIRTAAGVINSDCPA